VGRESRPAATSRSYGWGTAGGAPEGRSHHPVLDHAGIERVLADDERAGQLQQQVGGGPAAGAAGQPDLARAVDSLVGFQPQQQRRVPRPFGHARQVGAVQGGGVTFMRHSRLRSNRQSIIDLIVRLGKAPAMDRHEAESAAPLPFGSTIYQRVHECLREDIVAGRLPGGTRLKIADLAARFGLSQMPVREALQQLQGEGLVILSPNRGATVRRMDAEFVRQIFDIREALEGFLTRQAAPRVDPPALARLRAISRRFDEAVAAEDTGAKVRVNLAFHSAIMAVTGNTEALRLLELHTHLIGALRLRFGYRPGRAEQVRREHAALLRALARNDAEEAGRIHDLHIRHARDDMLATLARETQAAA
jgi:DNA-binding GntR family transcriptional regulator